MDEHGLIMVMVLMERMVLMVLVLVRVMAAMMMPVMENASDRLASVLAPCAA